MAIKMVREPSETPNINNIDDIVPMRYAYGNQNGYVIGKGNEISNTVNGLNFTVNSGRLVLQGVECDIDAVGVTITIDNIATKRYYVVYLQVNLGTNTASILSTYDTATYPTIDAGDDLTENTTGVARLPLYRFVATSGIISEVNKVVESVKYVNQNFIKNVKVDDAARVNNLNIKKEDSTGRITVGDMIIPYKMKVPIQAQDGHVPEIASSSRDISAFTPLTATNSVSPSLKYEIRCHFFHRGNEDKYLTFQFGDNISSSYQPNWTIINSSPSGNILGAISFYIDYSTNVLYGNYIEYNADTYEIISSGVSCTIYSLKEVWD